MKSVVADLSDYSFPSLPLTPSLSLGFRGEGKVRGLSFPLIRIFLFIGLLFLLPFFLGGCGIKAPPVAPESTIPAPVSDLRAWVRDGKILLQWKVPDKNLDGSRLTDLVGFKVFRQARPLAGPPCDSCPLAFELAAEIDMDFPKAAWVEKGVVFWQETSARPQNEYTYFVEVYNRYRSASPESNRVKIFWDDPPAAPAKVSLRKEDRALEITWEPVSLLINGRQGVDFRGCNIYRRSEGEAFGLTPLNAEPVLERRYWDRQVELGKPYSYAVRAVRDFRGTLIEGPSSEWVQGVPEKLLLPSIPTGLVAVWQPGGVALRWDSNPEPDIAGYNLYRRDKEEKDFGRIYPRLITENYFLDGSADPQHTYLYRLQAVDSSPSGKASDFSMEVEVPPAASGTLTSP